MGLSIVSHTAASVIYHLWRRNVHALLSNYMNSDEDINIQNKKHKVGGSSF